MFILLVAPLWLAGCTAPDGTPTTPTGSATPPTPDDGLEVGPPRLHLLALDGRWTFAPAEARAWLARAGLEDIERGTLRLQDLIVTPDAGNGNLSRNVSRAPHLLQAVRLDAAARSTLGLPATGSVATQALATALDVDVAATLAWTNTTAPTPLFATFYEMERTPQCADQPAAALCFAVGANPHEAVLRLRVPVDGQDLGFLPDLVELGPTGTPAYWNGSFESPSGQRAPFHAFALREGTIRAAEFNGPAEAGIWTIRYQLESRGVLQAAGAAGIVRLRSPGYTWFDDRYQEILPGAPQAVALLANLSAARGQVEVAAIVPTLGLADIDLLLDGPPGAISGMLVMADENDVRALDAARDDSATGRGLHVRPLQLDAAAPTAAPTADLQVDARVDMRVDARVKPTLLFALPADVDPADLPVLAGERERLLSAATRAPYAATHVIKNGSEGARDQPAGALFLAPATPALPWRLPDPPRWADAAATLENISRARTLVMGSTDLVAPGTTAGRVALGELSSAQRVVVAVGHLEGGPPRSYLAAAAFVDGVGHASFPRLAVSFHADVDLAAARDEAAHAWAPWGVAFDR